MALASAHGLITVAIGTAAKVVIATDRMRDSDAPTAPDPGDRIIELRRGFIIAAAGIWASADGQIDTRRDVLAAARDNDTAESFLQRYDRMRRRVFEEYLTARYKKGPHAVLKDCFCPVSPPHSLLVCEAGGNTERITVFEYIPTLKGENSIVLSPMIQTREPTGGTVFAAIGAAAPLLELLDPRYIEYAAHGPSGPETAARVLIEQAIDRMPAASGPPRVSTFAMREMPSATPTGRLARTSGAPAAPPPFPCVDTKDPVKVNAFVLDRFAAIYPNATPELIPSVFRDIVTFFAGVHPDYAPVDLRYHDLEHTLQATLCTALILDGRHAAREMPRIDAHHFELAIVAALLHDAGYLKLHSDNRGTGAKYTFCHVVRGCAFAASYLPTVGGYAGDVETVMAAINCTGPMNEISRLHFRGPVDEVIGCAVATADYLGQMAAADYPDELTILFEEFQESDEFLRVPPQERMFKSAYELIARTPQFWHRFVYPKLESDFQAIYRFLAQPYPDGPNAYLNAIEANIGEVRRRTQAMTTEQLPPHAAELPQKPSPTVTADAPAQAARHS